MTTLNNIMNLITPAVQKPAQGNGLSQQSPTLSDFLGMILSPTDAAAAQQNLPLSPADMKALTEKIAAMLNGNGVESSQKLPGGLMQLLSAPMAAEIQDADTFPPVTEADMAELAQMMNDIEPGAAADSAETDAQIAALITQTATAAQTPEGLAPEDLAAVLAQKIAAALQQQNKDAAAGAKAAATAGTTGAPAMATLQNILQLQGDAAAQPQQQTPTTPQTIQHHTAQPAAADDAPLPTPQPQQPTTDAKPVPQAPAVTGQNGFGQNGFGQGGFGQNSNFNQNGFTFFAQADGSAMTGMDTAGLQNASQSFAQYNAQATLQTLPAQTTQMIAVQIQRNAAAKVDSFTLQLDPADLGRLDVELKFHRDGSVQAHLSADRPETLAMLQKDSAHLERILQQAGFDTKDGSLSFDLRQQADGNNAGGTGNKRAGAGGIGALTNDNTEAANNAAEQSRLSGYIGLQGVNIMV